MWDSSKNVWIGENVICVAKSAKWVAMFNLYGCNFAVVKKKKI